MLLIVYGRNTCEKYLACFHLFDSFMNDIFLFFVFSVFKANLKAGQISGVSKLTDTVGTWNTGWNFIGVLVLVVKFTRSEKTMYGFKIRKVPEWQRGGLYSSCQLSIKLVLFVAFQLGGPYLTSKGPSFVLIVLKLVYISYIALYFIDTPCYVQFGMILAKAMWMDMHDFI